MTGGDALYWPCGHCRAGQGQRCVTRTGRPADTVHTDRVESVRLWWKYGQPLPVPETVLPRPRLIAWHGEPGDDPDTAGALSVINRTYYAVIGHGIADGASKAGGNDWTGWHFPDPGMVAGLVDLVATLAPAHWTVLDEREPAVPA